MSKTLDIKYEIDLALSDLPDSCFRLVSCPTCGCNQEHIKSVDFMDASETGTRQGGVKITFWFECGHKDASIIFAEHKGQVVMSNEVIQT